MAASQAKRLASPLNRSKCKNVRGRFLQDFLGIEIVADHLGIKGRIMSDKIDNLERVRQCVMSTQGMPSANKRPKKITPKIPPNLQKSRAGRYPLP